MLLDTIDEPKIKYKTKANMAFVAMANIEAFNKGASDYGVPTTALFQVRQSTAPPPPPLAHSTHNVTTAEAAFLIGIY